MPTDAFWMRSTDEASADAFLRHAGASIRVRGSQGIVARLLWEFADATGATLGDPAPGPPRRRKTDHIPGQMTLGEIA